MPFVVSKTMESAQKRREIDFRQQPPVKAAAPKEFKAKVKTRSKRTLFAIGFFVLFTVLLYTKILPDVLPGWIQISLAVLHASSAALAGYLVMRDLRRRPLPAPSAQDSKVPVHESAAAKAAREQKEHLLNSGHHSPIQPRRQKRWGNLVAAGLFCGVLGLWFTGAAPISAAETEYDFAGQLNEAGTITTLIMTEPSIAVPRPPRPMFHTILAARRIPLSRGDYQAALQLITLGQSEEARAKLDVAKKAEGLDPTAQLNLEIALAQSFLFEGKYPEAIKILKPLWDQQKNTLALAQMAVAALHANQYREARIWSQQLSDAAKEPVDKLRSMNLLLALDLLQWRAERSKHETEARTLTKDSTGPHTASLQNNLGVHKLFAAPPQGTAAQGNFNAALDLWNELDQANLGKDQHDPIKAAALQNIALCEWWGGAYEVAFKQIELAQKYRQASRAEGKQKPIPGDQAVQTRGLLTAALCENTLGRWQACRNKSQEANSVFRSLPRTDPHRLACALLQARIDISFVRYDEAISRCNDVLRDTTLCTPQNPLCLTAKLRLAEALLGKKRNTEARPILADAMAQLTSLRWNEYHPEALTYYRLLAQLETAERNYPAAKLALEQGEAAGKRMLLHPGTSNQYRPHPEIAALLAARANWSYAQVTKENTPQHAALLNTALTDWGAAEKEMTAAIGDIDALSHPLNGRYIVMQGFMLYLLGKHSDAEEKLRFWETEFLDSMPENHPWSAASLDVLVMILKAQNKDFKDEEQRAKEIKKAIAASTT
jgi:tetratricopeptide (TPR) repeat protein